MALMRMPLGHEDDRKHAVNLCTQHQRPFLKNTCCSTAKLELLYGFSSTCSTNGIKHDKTINWCRISPPSTVFLVPSAWGQQERKRFVLHMPESGGDRPVAAVSIYTCWYMLMILLISINTLYIYIVHLLYMIIYVCI